MNILIAVVAYNRPQSLQRLLSSIKNAAINSKADLVISIDYSGEDKCAKIANSFDWKFGKKRIISHMKNLGLRNHILSVGDLVNDYDALIMLEDDLLVSPLIFKTVEIILNNGLIDDPNLAGVGFYNYQRNEHSGLPWEAVEDGCQNYYMQVPCSWGQMWTKKQWLHFRRFYDKFNIEEFDDVAFPENVKMWPSESSWKKYFYAYLVNSNKWIFYPRFSLTTNFGDAGTHYLKYAPYMQSNLAWKKSNIDDLNFNFASLTESNSKYDAFFEYVIPNDLAISEKESVQNEDISLDINGLKKLDTISSKYLLSTKKCHKPIKQFQMAMYPFELNIINNQILDEEFANENETSRISLGLTKDFEENLALNLTIVHMSRVFSNWWVIQQYFVKPIKNSISYKLGNTILRPLKSIRDILK